MDRAEQLKEGRTLIVEVGGFEVAVVCPTVWDMVDAGLDPIVADITAEAVDREAAIESQQNELQKDTRKFRAFAIKLLEVCMVDPKLYTGDGECPAGHTTPKILGNLLLPLAGTMMDLMNKEVGEVGKATARFRVDADREVGADRGQVVRDEPVGDPAA
jgi:hypothetical protein